MVEPVTLFQHFQFFYHMFRGAGMVAIAIDRFGAPVALERATPGGTDVKGEIAVMFHPHIPVHWYIDEVPGGDRKIVQVLHHFAGCCLQGQFVLQEGQSLYR